MERSRKSTWLGAAGTLLVLSGTLFAPLAAQAGADGRKNTTIALGAAAAWELLHHQTLAGVALGAGAVVAEKKYEDARRSERDAKDRQYYYQNGRTYGGSSYRYNPRDNSPYYNSNNNNAPYYNGDNNNNNGDYDSSQNYGQSDSQTYYRHSNNGSRDTGRQPCDNGQETSSGQRQNTHGDRDNDNH